MDELIERISKANPYKLVLSGGKGEYRKIVFERKIISGSRCFQIEKYTDKQVFHENIAEDLLPTAVLGELMRGEVVPEDGAAVSGEKKTTSRPCFRQINVFAAAEELDIKLSKKGRYTINSKKAENRAIAAPGNNRKKKYILDEGMDIPVFTELGIFTKDGRVARPMYDKFRQINRFAEIVDDVMKDYGKSSINILDFGCGKSYLTFIVYYYLHEIKGLDVHITGLDLKEKVIEDCNALAKRFGYDGLRFEMGDINGYRTDMDVDMVMTLHACDTATDYALYNAMCWNAKYILSVPCCQHELNGQMKTDRLSGMTEYGIIKERMAALMTDAIRGLVLEANGYKVDVMEFIDIAHSPKNLLIRAVKKNVSLEKRQRAMDKAEALCEEFGFTQTLMELLMDKTYDKKAVEE